MSDENKNNQLNSQIIDYVTSLAKSTLGLVPFAGPLLIELAGYVIPNQRIDRIVKFAEELERKLYSLDQNFVRSQLTNENFTGLLEEGLRQAARSLSDERREYLAALITHSISSQDIEYIECKHLLRILGEVNDIEIIWLRYYYAPSRDDIAEFQTRHWNVLEPIAASHSDPPIVLDKESLQNSYKQHLAQLGLLKPIYSVDKNVLVPDINKITGYTITPLGKLLLRYIDFV
ncbi:MAG: hypothetical protein ABSE06_22030 [Anaerolineaceae bacterium]|jgi:hypothetical protein